MALQGIFFVSPNQLVTHQSGRSYKANSSGLLTVPWPDYVVEGGIGAEYSLRYLQGTTADRQSMTVANGLLPPGPPGFPFNDTTLSSWVFYAPDLGSTGWRDSTAAAV